MTIEEARKVGLACADLYPPTNPVVLSGAARELFLSHVPGDRDLAIEVVRWLAHLTLK
jgi:hypothetical protein